MVKREISVCVYIMMRELCRFDLSKEDFIFQKGSPYWIVQKGIRPQMREIFVSYLKRQGEVANHFASSTRDVRLSSPSVFPLVLVTVAIDLLHGEGDDDVRLCDIT